MILAIGVTLRVPSPDERADNPLESFYTLYEGFFSLCFLWLPVLRLILEYVTSYNIALSQITARSLRHLIGILVRGYETKTEVTLSHLRNYLEIWRVPKSVVDRYYISPAKGRKIIDDFPSKDDAYTDYSFLVALGDAVLDDLVGKVLTKWGLLGSLDVYGCFTRARDDYYDFRLCVFFRRRLPNSIPRAFPEDLIWCYQELSARTCHWTKHFSRERVDRALRLFHGVFCPSSSESSDHRTQFFVDMQTSKLTIREVYEKKRLTAEEKRAAEENRIAEEKRAAEGSGVNPEASEGQEVVPEGAVAAASGLAEAETPVEAAM